MPGLRLVGTRGLPGRGWSSVRRHRIRGLDSCRGSSALPPGPCTAAVPRAAAASPEPPCPPPRPRHAGKSKALGMLERAVTTVLSPVFVKAFTLTFLAEWGDRSQIATITCAPSCCAACVRLSPRMFASGDGGGGTGSPCHPGALSSPAPPRLAPTSCTPAHWRPCHPAALPPSSPAPPGCFHPQAGRHAGLDRRDDRQHHRPRRLHGRGSDRRPPLGSSH
jgi:hypothetical protein